MRWKDVMIFCKFHKTVIRHTTSRKPSQVNHSIPWVDTLTNNIKKVTHEINHNFGARYCNQFGQSMVVWHLSHAMWQTQTSLTIFTAITPCWTTFYQRKHKLFNSLEDCLTFSINALAQIRVNFEAYFNQKSGEALKVKPFFFLGRFLKNNLIYCNFVSRWESPFREGRCMVLEFTLVQPCHKAFLLRNLT